MISMQLLLPEEDVSFQCLFETDSKTTGTQVQVRVFKECTRKATVLPVPVFALASTS
jgi:hypothetical protein